MRGAVLDTGCNWADGADDGRCGDDVSRAERTGPAGSGEPAGEPARGGAGRAAETRIGFFEDDGLTPVTAETRTAVRAAAQALREAGFTVEPFRPRTLEPLRKLWWTFFVQCGAMFYEPTIRGKRERLSPIFREFLQIAEAQGELTATELLNAWAEMDLLRAKILEEMREYPVLLCPVASVPAWKTWRARLDDGRRNSGIPGRGAIHAVVQRAGRAGGGGAGGPVGGGLADRGADCGAAVRR